MRAYRKKVQGEYNRILKKIAHRDRSEKSKLKTVIFMSEFLKAEEENHILYVLAKHNVIFETPTLSCQEKILYAWSNFENEFKKEIM